MTALLIHCIHAACQAGGTSAIALLGNGDGTVVTRARRVAWALAAEAGIQATTIASGAGRSHRQIRASLAATRRRRDRLRNGKASAQDRRELAIMREAVSRLEAAMKRGEMSVLCDRCRGCGCFVCGGVGLRWGKIPRRAAHNPESVGPRGKAAADKTGASRARILA